MKDKEIVKYMDKVMASFSYIWPFGLILLPFMNKSDFLKRHIFDGFLFTLFITFLVIIKIVIEEIIYSIGSEYNIYNRNINILNIVSLVILGMTIIFQIYRIVKVWIKNK